MARARRKKKSPPERVQLSIQSLSHDGRGLAQREGKRVFVTGALPGEVVLAEVSSKRSRYEEGTVIEVLNASSQRVEPPCRHADICGGCSLQHMEAGAQIAFKQSVLEEQLIHFGGLAPMEMLPVTSGPAMNYRRKARLGVRFVNKKDKVLVGFREKSSNFIAELTSCKVLDKRLADKLEILAELIASLSIYRALAQIEVAMGDDEVALVLRHLEPVTEADTQILMQFASEQNVHLYLQPGGTKTVHRIWPQGGEERLHYRLAEFDLEMKFHPMDFTQVNAEINAKLVSRALSLLQPQPGERVLDLFCGLGNFSLPLARSGAEVVAVEGSSLMVQRGYENARHNGLQNVAFHAADLTQDVTRMDWAKGGFDKILIDPPRSGALEIVKNIAHFAAGSIVYVSCNPATLARDAGELERHGYRLQSAGVFDMFPHTAHVESIAYFVR